MRKHNFPGFATLVLGVLLLGSLSTAIAEEKRAFTVDDMLDLVEVGDVVMTPDGSRVFYSERRLNWKTNKYEEELMMISSEGGTAVPFVRKDGGEQFRISPDGRYLSMLREVDERPQVFLMPLDGGEPQQRTEQRGEIIDYKWSGDGKTIIFVAEEAMGEAEEKEFKLGADPIFVNEGPNGKNHGRWTHLWRIDVDSKIVKQVTDSKLPAGSISRRLRQRSIYGGRRSL
jgi:dipeptidyl aminopeptidase/acylaminoacyl peptidase